MADLDQKEINRQIRHIRGLGKTLTKLSYEVQKRGNFTTEDLSLLKAVGSDLVFKGCSIDFIIDIEKNG